MQKALEMGKTSATGSFRLFIGVTASTIIMAISTIILARLMTPEEYGLYSIALIPSYMAVLFRDWGVNSAITRYTASLRVENRENETRKIILAGLTFEIITSLILSLILISLSTFIASAIFQRPEASQLIAIASTTVLAGSIIIAAQSSFVGFERMELNSLTNICQAIVKTIASPILVFVGYSALGATLGYTISFIISAIISLTILILAVFKKLEKGNPRKLDVSQTLKGMLRYGVPLSIASIISGFLVQFYAFLMAVYCDNAIIGNYQVATQFATLLTFFTIPISTVLFPIFSKVNPEKEGELLQTIFTSSVKYSALILVPVTTAVMILSKPMISTLFGEKWIHAPLYLTLYVVSNFYTIFGGLSLGSLLAGIGETKIQMKLSLITLSFGMPLALLLIPTAKIIGLIITSMTAGVPSLFLGLYWIWKHYKIKADIKLSIKIITASLTAAAFTFLTTNLIKYAADWMALTAGSLTFIIIYLITAPLIGAINKRDIQNLKIMFSELGIISKLLNIPLKTMEKLLN